MFALIEEVHKYLHGGKLSPDMLMVESDVMKLEEYANKITGLIHDKDDVEAWVISKIAKAEQTIANVKHTLEVTYPKRFAHGGEVIKHDGEIIHMMLHHIGKYATKMLVAIRSGKIHIDEWMKHELAIAGSDIDSVYHYLDTFHKQKKEAGGNMDMEEDYFEADEYAKGGAVGKYKVGDEVEEEGLYPNISKYKNYASVSELNGKKVYNSRLELYGYINDDDIANWGKIASEIFVVKEKGSDKGHYWDKEDVCIVDDDKFAKGGKIGKAKLEKELHKLIRELSSRRLQTYMEGDTSDEENARQKERSTKLARYYEVFELLNNYADGGSIKHHKHIKTLTIELLEPTDKGWKVMEKDPNGIGKVKKGKISFYSNADIKDLFADKEGSEKFEDGGKVNSPKYENYLTASSSEIIRNTLNKVNKILAEDEDNAGFTKVTLPSITYIDKEKSIGADGLPHEWLVIYYGDEDIAMINENEIKKHDISNAKVKLIADYVKSNELVSKHIHKEHHKAKKYELGDMWSEDFDYDGLLEAASKIGASMSLSDVEMIFRSMEDVNYHRLAKLLDTYIKARKKTDNHKKRADSLNYFRKMLKKFNEEYKKGGKVIEAGRWVVYNPETNEIIKNVGSHVTAKKEMYKLWDTEKYNELGIMSYRRWSQENVFCEGGGVGHYEDGGGIISSFRLPASDTTPVGLGGIPNYNTPLDEWALHYDKGGSLYKSPSEYKEELEVKSDEEIARLYSEEFGLNIDDVLEDIEDERDEYIRELVHDYKTVLKSKGEI